MVASLFVCRAGVTRYIYLVLGVLVLWSSILALVSPQLRTVPSFIRSHRLPWKEDHSVVPCHAKKITPESEPSPSSAQLGIASEVYLISLPWRQDRRRQMEHLRASKEINWTVIDALDPSDIAISHIFDRIVSQRSLQPSKGHLNDIGSVFHWPADINALAASTEYLESSGSDLWTFSDTRDRKLTASSSSSVSPHPNITCATQDHSIPPFKPSLPDWMALTAPKISCWYSHVSAVRQFIDRGNTNPEDVAVFLEDDIDMEKDIEIRMHNVWTYLPPGWDMVFLGHCWSNESFYSELPSPRVMSPLYDLLTRSRIHPSYSPRCTHAYALSLSGARRLLQHLRYPPFAYSRALDQAFSWLIESGRLRAFSVVPSVVIQRKVLSSDIFPGSGVGSAWRERLVDGVFGT
ncbi:hypothetical protein DEU56DRAFT_807731 [Suillus clintonianus]|uniref:uncharacterized protein n=1 Tax=Suillus clintonianus TaxID=1904413 RepID=UPI001B862EAB|nr:uncharacterized protein DEU56DRAFT_807731 [Suillus clintonianus]KAG2135090.1 hypothetical protein DEU56DRAFT_807731 [Suillus clintonianus]